MTSVALLPDAVPEPSAVNEPPPALAVRSFGLADRGQVRHSNEDHFLIAELAHTLWVRQSSLPQPQTQYGRNRAYVLLVADGTGGHQAGEVASAITVETVEPFVLYLLKRFSNLQATDEQGVLQDFQAALRQADLRLYDEAAHHPEWARMGTTLTMAFISGRSLFVVHAGDSRCYLFRHGTLAVTHDPSERLSYYLFAEVTEKRPNYARAQAAMKDVCLQCHTPPQIDRVYEQAEKVGAETNGKVTAAKNIVDALRKEGVLSEKKFETPIDFAYFDLWHYDGRTAKHGAFMGGADFVQWHGNFPILERTVQMRATADEMRREHARAK